MNATGASTDSCGCCAGLEAVTPLAIANRPGLDALRRRVGEYADFYETLLSRLTVQWVDLETHQTGPHGEMLLERLFPLRDLRTRDPDDLTIALLDAWAVTADVLTFYSERIANEGYLRTAQELRSLIGLSNLVGYRRRPGVSASVFLAFTADKAAVNASGVVVPAGARVQNTPDPGLPPQTFETGQPLVTRPEWNVLSPRQSRPTFLSPDVARTVGELYVQGTKTRLSTNSPLLLEFSNANALVLRFVDIIAEDFNLDRTSITLSGGNHPGQTAPKPVSLDELVSRLELPPSIPPATPARLGLTAGMAFGPASAAADGLLARFHPQAARLLPKARASSVVTDPSDLTALLAPRVKASVYAYNAAPIFTLDEKGNVTQSSEWPLDGELPQVVIEGPPPAVSVPPDIIDLDTTYDSIQKDTWVVILRPEKPETDPFHQIITQIKAVQTISRHGFNFPAKVTRLFLSGPWLDGKEKDFGDIRSTIIYAAPEKLAVVDQPVDDPVCGQEIELDRLADGLQPGRWLIFSGERAGLPGIADDASTGLPAAELVMLNATRQDTLLADAQGNVYLPGSSADPAGLVDPATGVAGSGRIPLPGDTTHTFLTLSAPLAYCYKRATLKIYANVSPATHGETRLESLGSGDGSQVFQSFDLKGTPPPLTYTAAVATNGIQSSLNAYVNDVRWHEAGSILDLGPASHGYLITTDDKEKTSVVFGDGVNGARLPTAGSPGQENVRAVYRRGIGRSGNLRSGQINRILANADGMTGVVNPLPSTGGADPDGPDATRERAPLAVTALDRLVGVEDYADFSRLFAGIAKASAARLPTRYGHLVHVTFAGVDDIPIDATSDLYRSLLASLKRFGDPYLPVQLERRRLSLLVISARIRLDPDYIWEKVSADLRSRLQQVFGFASRGLGQDAYAGEAIAAMQAAPGVVYADLDLFTAVPESIPAVGQDSLETLAESLKKQGVKQRIAAGLDHIDPLTRAPVPAGLIMLSPDIPSTLLLSEIPNE